VCIHRLSPSHNYLRISSKTFNWGFSAEYAYSGTLDVDKRSTAPVVLGGRGDVVGSCPDTGMFFFATNFIWTF